MDTVSWAYRLIACRSLWFFSCVLRKHPEMAPQAVLSWHISRALQQVHAGQASCCHGMWQRPRVNPPSRKHDWPIRSLACFSNWTTGLDLRSCFLLISEDYHSIFEEFESLMYDFPLPTLQAEWLHARTSASSWKLKPHQLHSLVSHPAV